MAKKSQKDTSDKKKKYLSKDGRNAGRDYDRTMIHGADTNFSSTKSSKETTELYKAPRRAAAMYDDEEKDVKNQQILERTRKKIEQSKLLNELRKFQKKKKNCNTIQKSKM